MNGEELQGTCPSAVLDALRSSIAVLDRNGIIVAVNEAWRRFGRDNGCCDPDFFVGTNYVAVCENALADEPDAALEKLVGGVRQVMAGETAGFSAEYPCDSPAAARWYRITATRLGDHGVVLCHEDVTAQKAAEMAIRESERMLRSVLNALPIGVWLMDPDGRIVEGNRESRSIWAGAHYAGPEQFSEYAAWCRSTGQPIGPEEWAAERAILNGENPDPEEVEIECFDGTRKTILNYAIPLLDERKRVRGAIIVNQDITERARANDELHRAKEAVETAGRELAEVLMRERTLARIDPLTGALNRRRFYELAEYETSVATRYQRELSIILFDLDEFKAINDRIGHQGGDDLLRGVVQVVQSHLRQADVLGRYGGDEFAIMLPHTTAQDAALAAERMRIDIAEQSIATFHGSIVSTKISAGVAEFKGAGDTLDALIQRADLALYKAKKSGRNRVVVYSRSLASSIA
ncbi:MAG: diguanylate cyclase [Thermoanaerobaculia bacterium]